MSKIGIIVASANNNQKLAIELQKIAIELNYDSEIINLVDYNLPLYSTIEEEKNGSGRKNIFQSRKRRENLPLSSCPVENMFLFLHPQAPQQSVAYGKETYNRWAKIRNLCLSTKWKEKGGNS